MFKILRGINSVHETFIWKISVDMYAKLSRTQSTSER